MTKYFIAHLLKGDVAEYHTRLTSLLSDQYKTTPLHKKVQSHITVKIPFQANGYELKQLEKRVAAFAETYAPPSLTIHGFGRFGFRTVYMDVVKSQPAVELVRACVTDLNTLPWMQHVTHEGNKLHASVARFMTYKKFRRVWRHVKGEKIHFKTSFDSLAILEKDHPSARWEVRTEYPLIGSVSRAEKSHTTSSDGLFDADYVTC